MSNGIVKQDILKNPLVILLLAVISGFTGIFGTVALRYADRIENLIVYQNQNISDINEKFTKVLVTLAINGQRINTLETILNVPRETKDPYKPDPRPNHILKPREPMLE